MYDLLAAKQNLELEMQKVNQAIIEETKKSQEVEKKDIPQG
jgi:hypothetical protein